MNDEEILKNFLSQKITFAILGDPIEDRSDSAGSLIVIVWKETMILEVQVLVVKMERRHIKKCLVEKVSRTCGWL